MIFHDPGQFVDSLLLLDADQHTGGFHRGSEIGQRLLRHGHSFVCARGDIR